MSAIEPEQEEEREPVRAYLMKRGEFGPTDNRRCDACGRYCPHGARGAVGLGFAYAELCRRCWRLAGERVGEATEFGARVRAEARVAALDEAAAIADELAALAPSTLPTKRRAFSRLEVERELETACRVIAERLRSQARNLRGGDSAAQQEASS